MYQQFAVGVKRLHCLTPDPPLLPPLSLPCLSAIHHPLLLLYVDTCLQRLFSNPSSCLFLLQSFCLFVFYSSPSLNVPFELHFIPQVCFLLSPAALKSPERLYIFFPWASVSARLYTCMEGANKISASAALSQQPSLCVIKAEHFAAGAHFVSGR